MLLATFLGGTRSYGGSQNRLRRGPCAREDPAGPQVQGRVCGRAMMREGELPEWAETPSAPRALARITRPAGTRPVNYNMLYGK